MTSMIGVFDSGIGGLGVLKEMLAFFDDEDVVFIADRINAPYGPRSLEEVQELSHAHASSLIDLGATTVVVACNTASAAALESLRLANPHTTFVGMEPAVKPAAAATRSGVIGVLATEATFQGKLFASLIDQFGSDLRVIPRSAPEWVELVEAGRISGDEVVDIVREHIAPLENVGVDTFVLGCTHFPFLLDVINEVVGPGARIIDPAPAVAAQATRVHVYSPGAGSLTARVTGDVDEFVSLSESVAHLTFPGGVLPL